MDAQFLTQVAMFSGLDQAALQDLCCHLTATRAASPHPLQSCAIDLPVAPGPDQAALSVAELCCRLDALLLAHKAVLVPLLR